MKMNVHLLAYFLVILSIVHTRAQFWKLKSTNDRDLFILETRSEMASGICYKEMPAKSIDPELRTQLVSYCCPGYLQAVNPRAMECRPICMEDCTNGICSAPNVCECYPGYSRLGGRCEQV